MRRNLMLLVAAAVAVALAFGTGGFSAAELHRGVSVSMSDSDSALVSLYDPGDPNPPDWAPAAAATEPAVTGEADGVPVVYVHNRFADRTLTVELVSGESSVIADAESVAVAPDHTEPVTATVECVGDDREATLTVVAEGDGVSARIDFAVTVDCRAPSTPTPTATPADS